jgi:hypothetical protein
VFVGVTSVQERASIARTERRSKIVLSRTEVLSSEFFEYAGTNQGRKVQPRHNRENETEIEPKLL